MKHIFIVNPTSGHGLAKTVIPMIKEYFVKNPQDYEIIMTEGKGHASKIASHFSIKDNVTLYSVGGDGTAYEVLNGINDHVCMAIIPAGTGNDYYRNLEVPEKNLNKILIETIEGKEALVDYGIANDRRFMNCTTMGFDADINVLANDIGSRFPIPRSLVYLVSTLIKLAHLRVMDITITLPNETIRIKSLLTAVMNGKWYGGGFQPTPMSSIQDGYFDLCIVKETNLATVLRLLPKYMKGTHVNEKIVTFVKADSFKLQTSEPVNMGSDGETQVETEIVFRLMKGGLTLRVPKASLLKERELYEVRE